MNMNFCLNEYVIRCGWAWMRGAFVAIVDSGANTYYLKVVREQERLSGEDLEEYDALRRGAYMH
jgi:hypothetical protein